METFKWKVLSHPPYSPDINPSDYHVLRSMADGVAEQHFHSYEDAQKNGLTFRQSQGCVVFSDAEFKCCQKDGKK